MTAASIAFATDLVARVAEGGTVEQADGSRIVRTPANPAFRWGNFVLADPGADLTDPEGWARRHREAFPELDFTTVGIDDAHARFDEEAWRGAGFEVERSIVLRAPSAEVAATDGAIEEVDGEADWSDVEAIELELGSGEADHAVFVGRRIDAERTAVQAGRAAWLGLREDGRIVSALGVLPAPRGIARYQNVGTLAAYRRRGAAGRLVRAGAALAASRWGCSDLVIVADVDGAAIALYRRLGFRDAETQVQLTRMGRS
ncbi:GNAT family N-acetyltransferase [Amnibacterium sp.]|uniref:GNAT family N-acetyltransferase n=1 Tax=Amnibacterium sp. TaxID=1872496 RepID=UPI002632599E|nr:GNAT family N-acetyltransferase [Amnibacterium sp.]MCU1472550.1 GCN5-related N-acetyltransferase [Amnibacterium sp.]